MKKYLLLLLAVFALTIYLEMRSDDEDNAETEASATGPFEAEPASDLQISGLGDTSLLAEPAQPGDDAKGDAPALAAYKPTGDIGKDAQALVDKQLELAIKESDGENVDALKQEVTAMLYSLVDYYREKGKGDEFRQVMGQKLGEGIKNLRDVKQ